MARISIERSIKIYDDDHGWYVEVGADADGLGLCRIAYVEDGDRTREMTIPWHHASALSSALRELADRAEQGGGE